MDDELGMGIAFELRDNFTQNAQKIRKEFAQLEGITDQLSQRMNASMSNMQMGAAMMGAGAALVAPLAAAIPLATEFEKSMAELGAMTGVTGENLDNLGIRAQGLAMKFGGSVNDNVSAFKTILSRLGPDIAKSGDALQSMGDTVAVFAKNMEGDAVGAVNALTTAMLQYNVDLQDPIAASREMTKMMNTMAAGLLAGSAEVPQVAESLKVAGLSAKNAGLSFEEFNSAVQVMGLGSLYGSEAGTALRNVLGKLGESRFIPKDTAEELAKAGINVQLLADTTIPFADRLKHLSKIQGDAALVSKFFGVENKNAAMVLMQNIGTFEKWTEQVTGTQAGYDFAAKTMATFAEASERLKARLQVAGIQIGQMLMPMLSKLADVTGLVVSAFSAFAQTQAGRYVLYLAGAIGAALIVVGGFIVAVNLAQYASLSASLAFHSLGQASIASAFATGGLTGGLRALTTAAYQGLAAFAPYLAVIGAVAAVGYLAYQSYRSFQDVLDGTAKPAAGFLGLMQQIGGVIWGVMQVFESWDGKSFNLGGNESQLQALGILNIVLDLATWVVRLKEFVGGMAQGFMQAFTLAKNAVMGAYTFIVGAIDGMATKFGLQGGTLSRFTANLVSVQNAGKYLAYILTGVLAVAFVSFVAPIIAAAAPFIAIAAAIGAVVYAIMNWDKVWRAVVSGFVAGVQWLAQSLWQGFLGVLQNIPMLFAQAFTGAIDLVISLFTDFIPWLIGKVGEFLYWQYVTLPSFMIGAFMNAGQAIYDYLSTLIPGLISQFVGFLKWANDNVPRMLSEAFYAAGDAIYKAVVAGLENAGKYLEKWADEKINSLTGLFTGDYGTSSSSDSGGSGVSSSGKSFLSAENMGVLMAKTQTASTQVVVSNANQGSGGSQAQNLNVSVVLDGEQINAALQKRLEVDKARK